jgi:hypothetical protein
MEKEQEKRKLPPPPARQAQPKGYDPDTLPVDKLKGESEGLLWVKKYRIKTI